jgi:hypothetical protein
MSETEPHKERFIKAITSIGKVYNGKLDQEYAAALYLLTANSGLWHKIESYADRDGINFREIIENVDLSGGESVLVKWAGSLFGQDIHIDPIELMRLDQHGFDAAIESLKLRRYGAYLDDFNQ